MKFWIDTEFHDHGNAIELISIGVVAEDGREYYAVNSEYDRSRAHAWLQANVLIHLPPLASKECRTRRRIKTDLERFFGDAGGIPEFWADCGEYDWIVLRQLWGELTAWPAGWPFLAMDIEQWRLQLGAPRFPPSQSSTHHALEDARHTYANWLWLRQQAVRLTEQMS